MLPRKLWLIPLTHNFQAKKSLDEADALCDNIAGERNFYFGKLRRIEVWPSFFSHLSFFQILCQENETLGTIEINKLVDILYETEEGFEVPPEEATM